MSRSREAGMTRQGVRDLGTGSGKGRRLPVPPKPVQTALCEHRFTEYALDGREECSVCGASIEPLPWYY
jgi:hypothetical protein